MAGAINTPLRQLIMDWTALQLLEKDPDNKVMDTSMKEEIASALSTLTERERSVIEMYFGINRDRSFTLNEIGEQFSLTRERVRQIKEKAIRRLAHKTRSEPLRVYLGQ